MHRAYLALCGWERVHDNIMQEHDAGFVLQCDKCLRQIGSWNFSLVEEQDEGLPFIHPINEHRWYCPWICSEDEERTACVQLARLFRFKSSEENSSTSPAKKDPLGFVSNIFQKVVSK